MEVLSIIDVLSDIYDIEVRYNYNDESYSFFE